MGPTENGSPTTSDEALKLAIKLAVDAGEYERAAGLIEIARRESVTSMRDNWRKG